MDGLNDTNLLDGLRPLMMATGPANKSVLSKEILDFCGRLPIYKAKVKPAGGFGWMIKDNLSIGESYVYSTGYLSTLSV